MKILKIHLHPFAGVADRPMELTNGLNIIEGPNEFGKSTLNNALWHALFRPRSAGTSWVDGSPSQRVTTPK